jgi:sirohydrochlorin ferrochelatase
MSTPLVLAAHGSPHGAHAPAVEALRAAVGGGDRVRVGWLEHASPSVPEAVAAAALAYGGVRPVVVPLLLAAGHHARVDLPRLVGDSARVAPVLGPDPLLAAALDRRLDGVGAPGDVAVVVAGAGSSDLGALAQVEEVAALLGGRRAVPTAAAYVSGAGPRVGDTVRDLRERHGRVAVATYLLGPGVLADRVRADALAAGALVVSEPLGTAPELVALVRRRWADAARATAPLAA